MSQEYFNLGACSNSKDFLAHVRGVANTMVAQTPSALSLPQRPRQISNHLLQESTTHIIIVKMYGIGTQKQLILFL